MPNKDLNNIKYKKSEITRLFQEKKREILKMVTDLDLTEKALDIIFDSKYPKAFVRSFSEQDFYFLINEIGLEDSIELLSLASYKQWQYICDLEVWQKDNISLTASTKWLLALIKSDSDKFIKWFLKEQLEFIEYYLYKTIEIRVREHDQDVSELLEGLGNFKENFFTIDNIFYIRRLKINEDNVFNEDEDDEEEEEKEGEEFLKIFVDHLSAYDYETYQNILFEIQSVIPAETEEELYRLRNIRLIEKGFLPFDQAISIYSYLDSKNLKQNLLKSKKIALKNNMPIALNEAICLTYSMESLDIRDLKNNLNQENLFIKALQGIDSENIKMQIQEEFVNLCNLVISADQARIKDKKDLKKIVKKVCGFLSLGLESIDKSDKKYLDKKNNVDLIQEVLFQDIFRIGFGECLNLKWQAQNWLKKAWFTKQSLNLSFWGEEFTGILGGLLVKKPMFFDNYKTGEIYRNFESLQDINQVKTALNNIINFDSFLGSLFKNLDSGLKLDLAGLPENLFFNYKIFILTLWARNCLKLSFEFKAISLENFKNFFEKLDFHRQSFLIWASSKSNINGDLLNKNLGESFQNIFKELNENFGSVSINDLDAKYIDLFWIN